MRFKRHIMAGAAVSVLLAFAAGPVLAQAQQQPPIVAQGGDGPIELPTLLNAAREPGEDAGAIAQQYGNQMHMGIHYAGILPWVVDDLPDVFDLDTYDYVMEEYFISGNAGGAPYSTRFVVLRPENPANFSGMMLIETQHPGAGIFQTMSYSRVGGMQAGHMYVGVTNTNAQLGGGTHAAGVNAPRYAGLNIEGGNLAQNPIIAQVAALMQENNPLGEEWVPEWVVMTGASATSATASNFMIQPNGNTDPANALSDGSRPVDAMFIWDNAGYTLAEGGDLNPANLAGPLEGVPTIVLATQSEWDTAEYTAANQAQRAPDSETYRLFQVPGMSHIGNRYASDAWNCEIQPENRFMGEAHVYLGVKKIYDWLANGEDPGYARVEFNDSGFVTDEHGNAVGGVRSPQIDVPVAQYVTPNGGGLTCGLSGYNVYFDDAELADLYPGGRTDYARQFWASTLDLIEAGWFPYEYLWDAAAEVEGFGEVWVNPTVNPDYVAPPPPPAPAG